jgi:hypothetical protein
MNLTDMPTPGPISASHSLVSECYRAIQYTRVMAVKQPGSDTGQRLRDFFLKCAEFCPLPDLERAAALAAKAEEEHKAHLAAQAPKKSGKEPGAKAAPRRRSN